MATRAAIAAKDRAVKTKEIEAKERQANRDRELEKQMLGYRQMESASNTVKNISQAAYGKGGLAGAMSSSGNAPEWYKKFMLSEFAVSLPTFYRLGTELRSDWLRRAVDDVVAGIAVGLFVPTLPNQNVLKSWPNNYYKQSPINMALTRFMAEIRKLNSRIGDYDPSDIGLYWYAIIGLMLEIVNTVKALKAYNTYYSTNRYLAKSFIKSCGFDPNDFCENVPQYKASVMRWIAIFNSNAVIPSTLDLIKRYYWLGATVIKEHKGSTSQLFHFECPVNITLADDETYVSISKVLTDNTFLNYRTRIDNKIQKLFNSVGVVTMTADLRSAFPSNTLLSIPEFKGDELLEYSESMHDLEQWHNLRTLPSCSAFGGFGEEINSIYKGKALDRLTNLSIVVDNDGYLAQGIKSGGSIQPIFMHLNETENPHQDEMPIFSLKDNNFLNFYDEDYISEDAILEATRLRPVLFTYDDDLDGCAFKVNGTEVITDIIIVSLESNTQAERLYNVNTEHYHGADVSLVYSECIALSHVTEFDWFPWIQFFGYIEDNGMVAFTIGEIDHAVAISNDNLRIIHEGCAYSLFYVDSFKADHVAKK